MRPDMSQLFSPDISLQVLIVIVVAIAFFIYYVYEENELRIKEKQASDLSTKSKNNPMHEGRPHLDWECEGVFNPGAVRIGDTTHLVYRAVGSDGVSRLGYASSKDGTNVDEMLPFPVFSSLVDRFIPAHLRRFSPVLYPSGGSWGGCEDPRLVKIDNMIYLTYNAFDGWDFIRIGLTMIEEEDFVNKRFKWKRPQLISPPGQIHKNWMLFPEKINGKFAMLHSISPKVEIELLDSLDDIGHSQPYIASPVGARGAVDDARWDTRMRGAGAPPVKTDKGWVVFYHANNKDEPHKYKVGVLLLDLNDPKKIIGRLNFPILEPDEWYENDGKPGIVYVCGAVKRDDLIFLYYGGGDKRLCVAHLNTRELLDELLTTHS
jgi:predicted GH43/DUF377 family glycosyl hydrolase